MYKRFIEFMDNADCLAGSSIVVAAAEAESIKAVKLAMGRGLGYAVLTGDEKVIAPEVEKCGLADKVEIVHADSPQEAAVKACLCVREGRGSALMKGMANTSDFLHAVLSKEYGLRTGRLLSHLAVMEIPGEYHLSFCSDSGLNVAPDLGQKKQILRNALEAIHALGFSHVNVACLAANERVDPRIPSTVDAAALAEAWRNGEFSDLPCSCTVEGPMAVDVMASREAAEIKGIKSEIAGKVDLTIVPNIECGNVQCKTIVHYCHAQMAGVILGASVPVILVSRADHAESKFLSMALACIISEGMKG